MITSRRYDLDWVRAIAFLILIYFHTAIIFIPGGIPMIQNAETSQFLLTFVTISTQFRLALLFFVSGVGVAFARRRRTSAGFIQERSKRLLIPLIVGILLVVPPMVYTEKVFLGDFTGSLLEFYPHFFTDGVYPRGNLSWHHFWFIAYLYLFCLLGTGVFNWIETRGKPHIEYWISRMQGMGIYRFVIPLFLVEVLLRAVFPGFRDLIHDWASFFHWFLIFTAGFVIANNESLLNTAAKMRHYSLLGATVSTGLLYLFLGGPDFQVDRSAELYYLIPAYITWCAVHMIMVWCAILACVGYAAEHLRFSNRYLRYINEAVYPLFILHLTTITILGYWVVPLEWNLWLKFFFITTMTILCILVVYHFIIRPFDTMRLLFGVKKRQLPEPGCLDSPVRIQC